MKKWSLAHICAYISLAISITLLVLWCCNVGGFTVVSLDSFVGVIVALLAIVVTLAVGWQIYNSIEIKDKMEQLSILEERFKIQEKTINQELLRSEHRLSMIYSISAWNDKSYIDAFRYSMISLKTSMKLEVPMHIENLLKDLEKFNKYINEASKYPSYLYKEIKMCDDNIRSSSNYSLIEKRYDDIYNSFKSKVKEVNE
jgi:hypothetical protein